MGVDEEENKRENDYFRYISQCFEGKNGLSFSIATKNAPSSCYMWQTKDVPVDYTKPITFVISYGEYCPVRIESNKAQISIMLKPLKNDRYQMKSLNHL